MHATQRNCVSIAPVLKPATFCGKHLRLPDITGDRAVEGGLRLQGKYKASRDGLPLVSIVTVCLNSEGTLRQSMQSVFDQTYENLEYIVIDGRSKDNTCAILNEHAKSIDYYVSEPDKGLYPAMNKGIAAATGDYVLILNSDDWYETDCVAQLLDAKFYSGASYVSALSRYVNNNNTSYVLRSMPFDDSIRIRMPLRHETMLVPAHIYNSIGVYDESFRIIADFDFSIRTYEAGYTHYEIPRALLNFRTSGVSNTNLKVLNAEHLRLILAQFPFLEVSDALKLADLRTFMPSDLEYLLQRYRSQEKFCSTLLRFYATEIINGPESWHTSTPSPRVVVRRQPKISVVMPVYKARNHVAACIESVQAQTFSNFELLCINDASPDDSQQVIDQYAAKDPRIVSLTNPRNIGPGASRNRGVRHARGAYVYYVDSDDKMTPNALQTLLRCAETKESQLVRGAFMFCQQFKDKDAKQPHKKTLCPNGQPIFNTTLQKNPEILNTTEGHWSHLYRIDLARTVPYPEDLLMGEDSIFIISTLLKARSISIIDDVVYEYQHNANSAMNNFTFRKYLDDLEWRRRAWHMLSNAGMRFIGDRFLLTYWMDQYFVSMAKGLLPEQLQQYFEAFRKAFAQAGMDKMTMETTDFLRTLFTMLLNRQDNEARQFLGVPAVDLHMLAAPATVIPPTMPAQAPAVTTLAIPTVTIAAPKATGITPAPAPVPLKQRGRALRVAAWYTSGRGGAGIAARRNAEAFRQAGLAVQEYSPAPFGSGPDLIPLPLQRQGQDDKVNIWAIMREKVFSPFTDAEGFKSQETFSTTRAILDFPRLVQQAQQADVLNWHWVSGMLEYGALGKALGSKPIVWTLHDMNPFTGGCHYSESCDRYTAQCQNCPLAGKAAPLAHESWKIKQQAYAGLKNLHLVCPSQWMADRAAKSSLFKGRPVHVIANMFPSSRFMNLSKQKARARLNLPPDKQFILFGADALSNKRKGGDFLNDCIRNIKELHAGSDVMALFFGNHSLECNFPVRNLGYIEDERHLAIVYSAADVLVFPSREDNAPLTVGEAMLCGTPVVSFPVGYVPEVVEHEKTGYVAEYANARSLAEGVVWALKAAKADPLLAIRCRQRFMEQQQLQHAARLYHELFDRIAP